MKDEFDESDNNFRHQDGEMSGIVATALVIFIFVMVMFYPAS